MFTPEDLYREIVCRLMGERLSAINDAVNALKDLPFLPKMTGILSSFQPSHQITGDELNPAMTELNTVYNRNTDNNPNLNPRRVAIGKLANRAFVIKDFYSIV